VSSIAETIDDFSFTSKIPKSALDQGLFLDFLADSKYRKSACSNKKLHEKGFFKSLKVEGTFLEGDGISTIFSLENVILTLSMAELD